ncbi:N-(5'-phosphoribosyl)anthranilate isomerase, partial [Dissostichus eleginoides]
TPSAGRQRWARQQMTGPENILHNYTQLSGRDKESVIDASPRVADCSAELPHAPIMTHDGIPC